MQHKYNLSLVLIVVNLPNYELSEMYFIFLFHELLHTELSIFNICFFFWEWIY